MQNLLPKIATGDPGAVEDFLKWHTGMVWGLARRFCEFYAQDYACFNYSRPRYCRSTSSPSR